jgi:hypothetical protein
MHKHYPQKDLAKYIWGFRHHCLMLNWSQDMWTPSNRTKFLDLKSGLCISIYLSIYLSLYLSIYLSVYLSIYLSIYLSMALKPFVGPWQIFSFLIFYTIGRLFRRGISLSLGRYLHKRTTQTQNKQTQTSMPQVGFELTIPVFDRAKTVHALAHAATVIGEFSDQWSEIYHSVTNQLNS